MDIFSKLLKSCGSDKDRREHAEELFIQARNAALIEDDDETAIRLYEESLEYYDDPAPYQGIAAIYLSRGMFRDAIELATISKKKWLQMYPDRPDLPLILQQCDFIIEQAKCYLS